MFYHNCIKKICNTIFPLECNNKFDELNWNNFHPPSSKCNTINTWCRILTGHGAYIPCCYEMISKFSSLHLLLVAWVPSYCPLSSHVLSLQESASKLCRWKRQLNVVVKFRCSIWTEWMPSAFVFRSPNSCKTTFENILWNSLGERTLSRLRTLQHFWHQCSQSIDSGGAWNHLTFTSWY